MAVLLVLVLLSGVARAVPTESEDETASVPPLSGAEADTEEEYELGEVAVRSARQSRELRHDRASAGSVLLPQDFDDAGDTLADVLDRQAGLRSLRLGGPAGFFTLMIRGATSDQVLLVLDGVPFVSSVGGAVDLSRLPLGNLERIEIYRGASPLVLGGSAIGGVLSVTTRTGRERALVVGGGGGSFGAREARLFYAAPGERWDFSLGLDYSGWDGNFSYLNDQGTRFDRHDDRWVIRRNNAYNQVNALGKARFRLGEAWTLGVMSWFFHRDQGLPGLGQFESASGQHSSLDSFSVLSLAGENLGGYIDWTTRLAFRYSEARVDDPLDEIGLNRADTANRSLSPSLMSTAQFSPFRWWDIRALCLYTYERFIPSESGAAARESERHHVASGVESEFRLEAIDLTFLPSVRLEWADSRLTDGAYVSERAARDAAQQAQTFRFALVNESLADTRLMLSAGRSTRFPSLFELFGNNGKILGNSSLEPESAVSLDGGIIYDSKMLPAPHTLRLEAHAFFSDVRDLIQFVQTAQNIAVAENLDQARIWGIEAGIHGDFFRHLRVQGNYAYLDARNTGSVRARNSKRLPHRPPSAWFLRAEGYSMDFPSLKEAALFVDAQWIAANALDNANLVRVPARLVVNSGFSLELPRSTAKMSFTAQNLGNSQTADLTGYPLPGRSYHFFLTMQVL